MSWKYRESLDLGHIDPQLFSLEAGTLPGLTALENTLEPAGSGPRSQAVTPVLSQPQALSCSHPHPSPGYWGGLALSGYGASAWERAGCLWSAVLEPHRALRPSGDLSLSPVHEPRR
ncbi:hypothetical protein P7K49_015418 [Saguinus oedipus]|uniref:Uncharacterized protein n=1 Tax=Saguinus oedipus TaxID=9490 RepID=A0ABQ9V967_SAGOE|nr:hypothetical protein P7K49_015418 [Saguinus oedipus]